MREVIGQLATQGYLTIERNRGATVTKLSLEDVNVIYNILMRCESYAAGLFADRQDTAVIRELESLHERMQAKESNLSSKVWLQLNDDFHKLIYSNCGSAILTDLIFHTRLRIYRFRMLTTELKVMNFYRKQHRSILSAIRKGNGRLTEKFMADHIDAARAHRFVTLSEIGDWL
jgi:DNA-binding GntR family transcriptional regulator